MARDVCPSADLNESLGAANQRWKKVYVGEVVEEESNFISRLVTKLASKAAISVSSLSKESIFYRLLSYALDASGVEYNFNNTNAWYICFGDLLGGLIIQGGNVTVLGNTTVTLPISYSKNSYCVLGPGLYISGVCQQDITRYNDSFSSSYVQQYQMCGSWNWVTIGV